MNIYYIGVITITLFSPTIAAYFNYRRWIKKMTETEFQRELLAKNISALKTPSDEIKDSMLASMLTALKQNEKADQLSLAINVLMIVGLHYEMIIDKNGGDLCLR